MKKIIDMKTLKKFVFFSLVLISIILASACTEEIDMDELNLDTQDAALLVVEGSISDDTTHHWVKLTKTIDYDEDSEYPVVVGASVSVSNGVDTFALTETEPGFYETNANAYGIPGNIHTLFISDIDTNGDGILEEYSASDQMNQLGPADSINVVYHDYLYFKGWDIQLYATDPAENQDNYIFDIYKNDTLMSDTLIEKSIVEDELFNGNYTHGIVVYVLGEDKEQENVRIGDTITLSMKGISALYYDFLTEALEEAYGYNPMFSGPPANVMTNIEGSRKAIGFFAAYAVVHLETVYDGAVYQPK